MGDRKKMLRKFQKENPTEDVRNLSKSYNFGRLIIAILFLIVIIAIITM